MTQKELSYVEDAIGHEKNIISICEETLKILEDERLVLFIEEELNTHKKMKERLTNMLEAKANE